MAIRSCRPRRRGGRRVRRRARTPSRQAATRQPQPAVEALSSLAQRTALSRMPKSTAHTSASTAPKAGSPPGGRARRRARSRRRPRAPCRRPGAACSGSSSSAIASNAEIKRSRPYEDRRPRRPCATYGVHEENLGEPRHEQPDDEERPELTDGEVAEVAGDPRCRERDDEARSGDGERAHLRVAAAPQTQPHRHGEQAEEEAGKRSEEDCAQGLRSAREFRPHAHREDHRRTPRR